MKVLQIACGFSYSNVYKNLFLELNRKRMAIEVYVPQHKDPAIEDIDQRNYQYPIYSNKVIKNWDKYIYFTKIVRMKKDVEKNFKLSNIGLIHAHSLFSDGGVAYELYKKYGIPYVVAVRDTDVNQYFKKAKHLKPYALKILKNASTVVFLSKAYRDNVIKKVIPKRLRKAIDKKSVVIPNGISSFWLNNIYTNRPNFDPNKSEINLIYVGQIIKRKNIESAIKASMELSNKIKKQVNLLVVGKKKNSDYFNYLTTLGKFKYIEFCPQEELISYYRNADIFVMPSLTETFGLVYAEALSQGLPVIYTKGQGFDGHFEEGVVGYGVKPLDVKDISNKIVKILEDYDSISHRCIKNSAYFDWNSISNNYIKLYKTIIKL